MGPGAGGGGNAATWDIDFKVAMMDMLTHANADTFDLSIADVINNAVSETGNPYSGEYAFDPSAQLSNMDMAVNRFAVNVDTNTVEAVQSRVKQLVDSDLLTFGSSNSFRDVVASILNSVVRSTVAELMYMTPVARAEGVNNSDVAISNAASKLSIINQIVNNDAGKLDSESMGRVISNSSTISAQEFDEILMRASDGDDIVDAILTRSKQVGVEISNEQLIQINQVVKSIITDLTDIDDAANNLYISSRVHGKADSAEDLSAAAASLDEVISQGNEKSKIIANDIVPDLYANLHTDKVEVLQSSAENITKKTMYDGRNLSAQNIEEFIRQSTSWLSVSINSIVESALQKSSEAASSTWIDSARTSYENSKLPGHLRSIARYASGMASLNAVQHSTFVIGMALMESEFDKEVDLYASQLSVEMAKDTFNAYVNQMNNLMQHSMDAFISNIKIYLDENTSNYSKFDKMFTTIFSSHLEAYFKALSLCLNEFNASAAILFQRADKSVDTRTALQQALSQAQTQLLQTQISATDNNTQKVLSSKMGMSEGLMKLYASARQNADGVAANIYATSRSEIDKRIGDLVGLYSNQITSSTSSIMDFFKTVAIGTIDSEAKIGLALDQMRVQYKQAASELLTSYITSLQDKEVQAMHYSIERDRIAIAALADQYNANLDISSGYARWDLEAFQYGSNAMASGFGGVVSNPQANTKRQSALSGALAGALIGAKVSGGHPIGIGIGAAVGLLSAYV